MATMTLSIDSALQLIYAFSALECVGRGGDSARLITRLSEDALRVEVMAAVPWLARELGSRLLSVPNGDGECDSGMIELELSSVPADGAALLLVRELEQALAFKVLETVYLGSGAGESVRFGGRAADAVGYARSLIDGSQGLPGPVVPWRI